MASVADGVVGQSGTGILGGQGGIPGVGSLLGGGDRGGGGRAGGIPVIGVTLSTWINISFIFPGPYERTGRQGWHGSWRHSRYWGKTFNLDQ